MSVDNLWFHALAMALGVLTHVFVEVAELRKIEGAGFHFKHYLLGYPYRNAAMVGSAIGAFWMLQEANQFTMAAAFSTGYMVESLANKFSDRVKKVT